MKKVSVEMKTFQEFMIIIEATSAADEAARRARQMDAVGAAAGANPKAFADAARKEAKDRAKRRREHLANVDKNNR